MDLNVIICTHNPRKDHLERTLVALAAQDLDRTRWDLVIVDNASSNGVCETMDLSWHPQARLVREGRIGLTMARLRGIAESVHELIVFVDDDNELAPDYLSKVLDLAGRNPRLGVLGAGRIEPEYEIEPIKELEPYLPMLALRSIPDPHWSNEPDDAFVPWGAGLIIRREVAQRYFELIEHDPRKQRLDRSGKGLNSCGDDEFSWVATEMGWGKGIFPDLCVKHLIGAPRLQKEYLLRLAEGHAFSHALLTHLHGGTVRTQQPPPSWSKFFGHLFRLQVGMVFLEGTRLWDRRSRAVIDREFDDARRKGVERFHHTVND